MGEVLKAAIGCVAPQTLTQRELNILQHIALHADDENGPVLQPGGMAREGRIGFIESALGSERSVAGAMHADMVRMHLPVFYATGWLREVDDPALDGAHQLNMAKLRRLLDQAEAGPGVAGPKEPDVDRPGDFTVSVPPEDVTEQVDRLLIRKS